VARRASLLARDAAIKLVRPEVLGARDENEARHTLQRFEREAQATAALSSPHTIQVFDFGITQDGTFYYVMELLAGRDLESLVREFGPLPPKRVLYLLVRCVIRWPMRMHAGWCTAISSRPTFMSAAWASSTTLPSARLRSGQDQGLIGPWRRVANARDTRELDAGTPAYMAPEVILGDSEVDRVPTSILSAASRTSCSPESSSSRRIRR
jgi:serine/threonine-protein kinase